MFLSKSSSGIYYLYYRDGQGKRQKITTHSRLKADANRFLQLFKIETRKQAAPVLLNQFINDFLAFAETNFSKGTKEIYERTLNRFQMSVGNISLTSITPQHWDTFKTSRLSEGIAPVTVNIGLRTLKAAFFTATRWKLISVNPFSKQTLCPVSEHVPVFFTKDDFQSLIRALPENWLRETIIFGALTGLRRGELVNLQWSDVDLERRIITIQSSPTFKTKSGKMRIIPLNDTAMYLLRQKNTAENSQYVFAKDGQQIKGPRLTRLFKQSIRTNCISNDRLHFHSLRHTFASWLVQDGVSLYEVQKLLGHSNIAVTQIYSHLQPEQLHNTVNKIKIALN